MIPELAIAVLACARIGAVHSVIFADSQRTLSVIGFWIWMLNV